MLKFYTKAEGSRRLRDHRWPYVDIAVARRRRSPEQGGGFEVLNRTHPAALLDKRDRVDFDGVHVWAAR